VENLSSDHDQIFMSFNIEHWYPVLGPSKTAATVSFPIGKAVALALVALHNELGSHQYTKDEISCRIQRDSALSATAAELQRLIAPEGSFIKTSARSCKDVAPQIGLTERYRELLLNEITVTGKEINEMRLRSLFMEAGRHVLRFTSALDFLVACVLSERMSGVQPFKPI
jgi:hypothetical protein